MLVKVGVYCLRGGGHWDTYDQEEGGSCGMKGPDVLIDVDREEMDMYPEWLRQVILHKRPEWATTDLQREFS